jgi:predicted ribosome quality control (RQC) complex YloA/Tae2 family protein
MGIKVDFTESAQQNADDYYKAAKKLAAKKEGAERTVKELEKKLKEAMEKQQKQDAKSAQSFVKRKEKQWYEKFHWFFTSNNTLVIGGRDAQQNELINSRYFAEEDLFFHANIFGASAVVLKDGAKAWEDIRNEAAQFAACYSSAWDEGLKVIDVYGMRRDQVSKSTGKGSLGTGSFLLSGEREWHRDVQLSLVMFLKEGKLNVVPALTFSKLEKTAKYAVINQGNNKKSDAAKKIAAMLGYNDLDEIIRQLPTGGLSISGSAKA